MTPVCRGVTLFVLTLSQYTTHSLLKIGGLNMKNGTIRTALTHTSFALCLCAAASAQNTPGYNDFIPPQIMTPDTVETPIGTLKFFDGFPNKETTQKLYDNLDFMRGTEVFLTFVPAASIEAVRRGMVEIGATNSNQGLIFEQLLDSSPLLLTGNTDTVYASVILDLEKDGPTVVEIPPGSGPGTVNDAFFRFVIDMGAPGTDGAKAVSTSDSASGIQRQCAGRLFRRAVYLVYQLADSAWILGDGKPDAAAEEFQRTLEGVPAVAGQQSAGDAVFNGSGKPFNTIHANNEMFYEELATVIAKEPIDFIDAELRGMAASIGIRKDKPFAPDARMKAILTSSAAVGNATARAIAFQTRDPQAFYYENSRWKMAFVGGDYKWLIDGGIGGRNLDARTLFFYQATVNTPAMVLKTPGVGSQYAYTEQDADGNYLDGSKNYRLRIPANVPAKDFWSVVIYDPQTRSELQPRSPFRARTTSAIRSSATPTVPPIFTSAPNRLKAKKQTGFRRYRVRAGTHS